MKNRLNSRGFAPIIILILLVLVGGAFYLVFIKNKPSRIYDADWLRKYALSATPLPSLSPVAIPIADLATANWETYTKGQLSFQYPADWTVTEQQNQTTVLTGPQDGRVLIFWDDKTGNKPCVSDAQTLAEKIIINAQVGKIGYCVRRLVTEVETISSAAEGPIPPPMSSIRIDSTTGSGHSPAFSVIEATIKQILSTFKFTQ